ncbi:ATPase [Aureococcus anophagefferens]|nr:ATPase [Aureococcus anophagefferens]
MDDPLGSIMDDDDDDVELEYTLSEEDFDLPSGEEDFGAEPESNAVLYPQASVASAAASEASQATVVPAYAPPRPCLDVDARVGAAKRAFCGAFARRAVAAAAQAAAAAAAAQRRAAAVGAGPAAVGGPPPGTGEAFACARRAAPEVRVRRAVPERPEPVDTPWLVDALRRATAAAVDALERAAGARPGLDLVFKLGASNELHLLVIGSGARDRPSTMGKYALVDEESPEEEGLIPETRLEVSGMQYAVGEKVLLEEVSVVFQPRHLTALMGPSGAGKTTLMNEDVLYPSLTVKQTLYYSSFLRCPEKWSREAKTERVDVILSKLNLKHVENGIVGDHTTKGSISGGQKRRLSAAIEFLSFRPVMLMDEPTSTTAPCPACPPRGGAPCPESENPADHALYVLARGDTDGWHAKWKAASKPAPAETVPFEDDEREDSEQDYPISFMTQYRLLLLRSVHIWVCDPSQGPLVWGMTVFSTIMYASAYFSLHDSVSRELAIITFVMFIYQAASTPLCVVMPLERAVVLRDYRNGVFSTAPYWLARATPRINGAIISFLACAIVYPCLSFTFKNAMIPFKFFVMTTLLMSCCMLLGLIIGISSPSALAAIKIVPPSLVFQLLTCQVLVPQNQFPAYLLPAKYINLLTWSVKYLMVEVFAHTSDKADTPTTAAAAPAAAPKPATATATPVPEEKQVEKAAAASPLTEALLEEPGGGDYGSTEEPKLCASRLDAKPVSLRAHAITLWRDVHSADKKATLHDVSVSFEAKTTTALMGPSGAGKTTLIDVLTGRTLENDLVEGVEDILLADLTVRDILYFTAELRCAGDMTQGEKRARADEVIAQLGLQAKADVVVGSTEKPGISGGQKKRVSIGMDLLANCSVMCLDEPTTGLDAAAALSIADVVMSLAKVTGRTMVCTIHQPTWELISRFDQLTILVQGRLAFCEQPAQLAEDGDTMWTDLWKSCAMGKAAQTRTLAGLADASAPSPVEALAPGDELLAKYLGRYPTPFLTQYWILLKRCTLSYLKDEDQSVEHVMPSLMQSVVTGLIYLNFSPANPTWPRASASASWAPA